MAASSKRVILNNVCSLCRFSNVILRKISKTTTKMQYPASIVVKETTLDPTVMQTMERDNLKMRYHPGVMRLKTVKLPERLERAVSNIVEKYPIQDMQKRAKTFQNYLHGRHPPIELAELRLRAKEIEEKLLDEKLDLSTLPKGEVEKVEQIIKANLLQKLRTTIYKWKPLSFDAHGSLLYMVSRICQDYSVILKCFFEISKRDPDFHPKALLDLGSGVSSVVWAANEVWRSKIVEFLCFDKSVDISTLARLILQDGEDQKDMHIPGVYFREFLPSTQENTYDIVVSCYTLLDQASRQERLDMVLSLWKMTDKYLVLVENGSIPGFQLINEARNHILQSASDCDDERLQGHVFAPCPHDEPCPKFTQKQSPCFSQVYYRPLKLLIKSECKVSERYSYVIFKKGKRTETSGWPRVVQEVTKVSKHIHCHLCCPSGQLHHEILTKKKNGKDLYQCVRYTSWGDLLPVRLSSVVSDQTSENTEQGNEEPDILSVSNESSSNSEHTTHVESDETEMDSLQEKPLPT